MRHKVFISYHQEDERYLRELIAYLKSHVKENDIILWENKMFASEHEWRQELENTFNGVAVAVLLLSSSSIDEGSSQIELLEFAKGIIDEKAIQLVFVSDLNYDSAHQSNYTVINLPDEALCNFEPNERRPFWQKSLDHSIEAIDSAKYDVPETKALLHAILSRYPDLSVKDAGDIFSLISEEVAKRIGSGDTLASVRLNDELKPEVKRIRIDKLED